MRQRRASSPAWASLVPEWYRLDRRLRQHRMAISAHRRQHNLEGFEFCLSGFQRAARCHRVFCAPSHDIDPSAQGTTDGLLALYAPRTRNDVDSLE